ISHHGGWPSFWCDRNIRSVLLLAQKMAAFEELGLLPELGEAVAEMNWELPTAIQCDAVPAILGGGDVLIAAETGSGKTGAFSLPVTQIAYETRKDGGGKRNIAKKDEKVSLNTRDRDVGLAIDENGLRCESRAPKVWNGARANGSVRGRGRYYYEVDIVRDGLCRVGWSTERANLNLGTDNESWGFGGTGKKSHNRRFDDYGESFTMGDTLGCLLDLEERTISWSKNGLVFPAAFSLPPSSDAFFPAVLLQSSALLCNFGSTPFKFLPKGWTGVTSAASLSFRYAPIHTPSLRAHKNPLAMILSPTYELVEQTLANINLFAAKLTDPPVRTVRVAGGGDTRQIIDRIDEGVEIVVGTPARVCDLVESGGIPVEGIRFLILDEADQMVSQQSARMIERLMEKLPRVTLDGKRLQIIVCSATLHNQQVKQFADRYMHFPAWIDLKGMESISETVHHVVCPVDPANDKQWIRVMHSANRLEDDGVHMRNEVRPGSATEETLSFGTKILKGIYVLKAIEALEMKTAIIFCRTKQQCDQMEAYLRANGHDASSLHGDRSPEERRDTLSRFKTGRLAFLICTDVAARGLDVAAIPFVINVTLPDEKTQYIHRVGRVGRADRMGLSISLVSDFKEKVWYHTCKNRGVNCTNRRDVSDKGCTIWYNEKQLLGDIEEHLGMTISTVDSDLRIPVDEMDGRVVYGAKRSTKASGTSYADRLKSSVAQLADLERNLQTSYLTITQY
ncbi:hypothetical protein PMAYCL1PPCAC_23624, partial [Pristionchus mayeri]